MVKALNCLGMVLLLAGCAEPRGSGEERERSDKAGEAYARHRDERTLPAIADPVTADGLLRRAFAANASLEASYHEWRSALERVGQASSWDQPQLRFEYLTSSGRMQAWDRTTLGATQTIPTAGKRGLAADRALAEARRARFAFEQAKFDLQMKVLSEAADYRYLGEAIAALQEQVRLMERAARLAAESQRNGKGARRAVLAAENARDEMENELLMLQAQRPAKAASLNALLGREASEPLPFPRGESEASIPDSDADLLTLAAERNPELAAMAEEVKGRRDVLAYARRMWIPDLTIGYEAMGDVQANLMGMLMLPLAAGRIRAEIREARSMLAAAEAQRLSSQDNLKARLVMALSMARDTDRQTRLYGQTLLPRAQGILESLRSAYRAGKAEAMEVIEAERAVLELRVALAGTAAARERSIADLEAILAVDRQRWPQAIEAMRKEKPHE